MELNQPTLYEQYHITETFEKIKITQNKINNY